MISADLLASEDDDQYPSKNGGHIQDDVFAVLDYLWSKSLWPDLAIFHPPCTYLASSGARWWKERQQAQADAISFVFTLLDAPIPRIALENPVGRLSTVLRKPEQIIQPWMFGDEATKTTCLWLKNLPF